MRDGALPLIGRADTHSYAPKPTVHYATPLVPLVAAFPPNSSACCGGCCCCIVVCLVVDDAGLLMEEEEGRREGEGVPERRA